MKTMKIYEHGPEPRRKPKFQVVRAGLALVAAFGVGLYFGSTTPWSQAEAVADLIAGILDRFGQHRVQFVGGQRGLVGVGRA